MNRRDDSEATMVEYYLRCAREAAERLCTHSAARYHRSDLNVIVTLTELWNENDESPGCGFYADLARLPPTKSLHHSSPGGMVTFTRISDTPSDADRQASVAEKWGPGGCKSSDGGPL